MTRNMILLVALTMVMAIMFRERTPASVPPTSTSSTSQASAPSPESQSPPARRAKLRYGGDMDFPPYEWLDSNGVAHGFQVDLIRELAQQLNMDVEVRLGPWHEIYADLLAGKIDVVTMSDRPVRRAYVEFCEPHTALVSEIFVRKGATYRSKEDLIDKELIVQKDGLAAHVIADQFPSVKRIEVSTQADALRLLASGRHDAAIVLQANGRHIIRELNLDNLRAMSPVILTANYSFCTRKGDTALRNQINDALRAFKQDEEYNEMFEEWLGRYRDRVVPVRTVLTWVAIVTLPVLALLGAWAAWTRTLHTRVAKQTNALREELRAKVRAEREVRLLLNELDHRVRNMLASIVSLAEQQPAGDRAKQFRADFVGRVRAMATAHDAFRDKNGRGLTFDTALRLLARHLDPNIHERIRREGPDLCMMSPQATPVCLVLHELLTNAMRYGALSIDHGDIVVHTSVQSDGASILWQEYCNGAPPCEIKPGFGLTLMQGLVVHQLRGRLKVEMGEHGVEANIFIPNLQECSAEALRESGAAVS